MSIKKVLQLAKFFVGWPISFLALLFIVKIVASNQNFSKNIQSVNLWLLFLGLLAFLPYFFFRSLLWQQILKEKGTKVALKDSAFLWESSEIKRFAPGFIWPFISKTIAFSSRKFDKRKVAYSLFIEVEAFLIGAGLVSLMSIPFVYNYLPISSGLKLLLISIFTAGTFLAFLTFLFSSYLIKRSKKIQSFSHIRSSLPHFSPAANLRLIALSFSGIFFFGLGTYLVISSIAFLTPVLFLNLIGLFALSMLIGYLSFITPMGLGVREAILISGLSALMPFPIASACAIYARIGLIISELIFFQFTIVAHDAKHKLFVKTWDFVSTHKQELLVGVGILAYIAYFTTITFLRYDNFYTGRFDLGNMDQTVWNTIHGRIFQISDPDGVKMIPRLAFHADFILILISPLYRIWSDPRLLLVLQTVVVALGTIFIFKISRMILGSKNAAAVFSFMYLLNPLVQYANLYDFHPVTLATTLLLGAFYFFMKRKYVFFLIFAILAGLTKEEVWLVVAVFGFYILVFQTIGLARKKFSLGSGTTLFNLLFGLGVSGISLFIFYYLIWIAIPGARGSNHFALSYYSDFGDSPLKVILSVMSSPGKVWDMIRTGERLGFLGQLFFPLGFTSLASPVVLIFALPDLAINLLSSDSNFRQIYYQYTSTITPFLFIASIFGVKNLSKWFPKKGATNILLIFVSFTTLSSAFLFGPLPGALNPDLDMVVKPLPDRDLIHAFISGIPLGYRVAATNNLGSHLSRRRNVFTIPQGLSSADIIVFLLNDRFARPSLKAQREMVASLKKNPNYKLLFRERDFVVFKKNSIDFRRQLRKT